MNFKRIFASILCVSMLFTCGSVYASDPKAVFLKAFADTTKQMEKEAELMNATGMSDELILELLGGVSELNLQAGVDMGDGETYRLSLYTLLNNITKEFSANAKTEQIIPDDSDAMFDAPRNNKINLDFDVYISNDEIVFKSPQLMDNYVAVETNLTEKEFNSKKLVKETEASQGNGSDLMPITVDSGYGFYKYTADLLRFDRLFGSTASLERLVEQAEKINDVYTKQFLKLFNKGTFQAVGNEIIKTASNGEFAASNYKLTITGAELTAWCHELAGFVANDKNIYDYYNMIYNNDELTAMVIESLVYVLENAYIENPIAYTISLDQDGLIVKHSIHTAIPDGDHNIIVDVVNETKGRTYLMNDTVLLAKVVANGEVYEAALSMDGYVVPVNGRYDYDVNVKVNNNGKMFDLLNSNFKLNTNRTTDNMSMELVVASLQEIMGVVDLTGATESTLKVSLKGDYAVNKDSKSVIVNIKDSVVKAAYTPEIKLNVNLTFGKAVKTRVAVPSGSKVNVLDLSQSELNELSSDVQDKYYKAVYGMSYDEYTEYTSKLWDDFYEEYYKELESYE